MQKPYAGKKRRTDAIIIDEVYVVVSDLHKRETRVYSFTDDAYTEDVLLGCQGSFNWS